MTSLYFDFERVDNHKANEQGKHNKRTKRTKRQGL